jgi:SM-20-related protein
VIRAADVLDLDRIRAARLVGEPFDHVRIEDPFRSRTVASALAETFPTDGYTTLDRSAGTKRYRGSTRCLVRNGKRTDGPLSASWRAFVDALVDASYRDALASVVGPLAGLSLEVSVWRHAEGSFIDPHLDKEAKVVSHLFYFNDPSWEVSQGGTLRLLRSDDLDDVALEVLPHLGRSIAFRRSERSWHGCPPVRGATTRLAAQIVFHHPELAYSRALGEQRGTP